MRQFVGWRSVIKANPAIQGEALVDAPVVLQIPLQGPPSIVGGERLLPFSVRIEITEQRVGEAVASFQRVVGVDGKVEDTRVSGSVGILLPVTLPVDAHL